MAADAVAPEAWFAARVAGAPDELSRRAQAFFHAAPGDLVTRLAAAGEAALGTATRGGADRSAALDLLAADALITLALLAGAEMGDDLGAIAVALRARAAAG